MQRFLGFREFGFALSSAAALALFATPAQSATTQAGTGTAAVEAGAPKRAAYDGPPLLLGRGKKKVPVGGYGSIGGGYTRLMGHDSGYASMEGALLLDHRLSLGLAGYGFSLTPRGPSTREGERREFGAAYGGFVARYSVFGQLPVYGTFGVVLGAGALNLHRDDGSHDDEWGWNEDEDSKDCGCFDPFLVVQPEFTLHANVARWLRVGATIGYRFTSVAGRFGVDESGLNGIVLGGAIELGWF